jgi:hypothetical protein
MPQPDYVEYGSLATVPGPLRCLGSTQWGFMAEADHGRLDALCRRIFAEPTGGEVDLRPLGSHVLITLGRIERIVSEVAPFDRMGSSPEGQAAVWIPVGRVRGDGDRLVAEELLMFTPFMWVDNPISLPSGREMYGFAKTFGWMELPEGDAAVSLGLDVFGMDFDRDEVPTRRPLLRLEPGDPVGLAELAWTGLLDLAHHLRQPVEVHAGLRLAESIVDDVRKDAVRQAFLHQVRSPEDGRRAALQQVTEVAYRVLRFRGRPLRHEYRVTVSPLDSHPLGAELGLGDQTISHAFRTESDFVVESGRVLWDSGSVQTRR